MSRFSPLVLAVAVSSGVLLAGCGGSAPSAPPPTDVTTPASPTSPYTPQTTFVPTVPTVTTATTATTADVSSGVVRGHVYDRNGRAMAGVIVEFKNLSGGNGHTTTRSDGSYAIRLPPDVYTALALTDQPDSDVGFEVVGGDNSVSVPETTRVDFQAYDIGSR